MGASASLNDITLTPLDASDITSLEQGQAEIAKIRSYLQKYKSDILEENPSSNDNPGKYIIAVDDSKSSEKTFEMMARYKPSDFLIEVVHVRTGDDMTSWNTIKNKYEVQMNVFGIPKSKYSIKRIDREGDESYKSAICSYVNDQLASGENICLIGVGFRGRNRPDGEVQVMGSTTDITVQSVQCAACIVKMQSYVPKENEKKIFVVASDADANAHAAVELAKRIRLPNDEVHVVKIGAETKTDLEATNQAKYEQDSSINFVILPKSDKEISEIIMEYSDEKEADCIVLGSDRMIPDSIKQHKRQLGHVSARIVEKYKGTIIVAQLAQSV